MSRTRFPLGRHSFACLLASLLAVPLVSGCGERTGKVSGQVLYKDKPVPGGTVMFRPAAPGSNLVSAALDAEGRYELTVGVGEAQILVDNRELAPREKAPPPTLPPGVKLPGGAKGDAPPAGRWPQPAHIAPPASPAQIPQPREQRE